MKLIFFKFLAWVTPVQHRDIYPFPIFYLQYVEVNKSEYMKQRNRPWKTRKQWPYLPPNCYPKYPCNAPLLPPLGRFLEQSGLVGDHRKSTTQKEFGEIIRSKIKLWVWHMSFLNICDQFSRKFAINRHLVFYTIYIYKS